MYERNIIKNFNVIVTDIKHILECGSNARAVAKGILKGNGTILKRTKDTEIL